MSFHSNLPLSSGEKDSGKPFTFTVLDDVVAEGLLFIAAGAQGNGTIVLAGRAGANGHEGDLTIRLDNVSTADGNKLVFNDQRIHLNPDSPDGFATSLLIRSGFAIIDK